MYTGITSDCSSDDKGIYINASFQGFNFFVSIKNIGHYIKFLQVGKAPSRGESMAYEIFNFSVEKRNLNLAREF